ncbi:MAG: amidohydrolase [Verrucomicrobia bacterium]|nr:amidohydrolase [Verrucomicrobiota bacterium]
MRIVDAHVHLYPPEINRDPAGWAGAHGEPHWALLCTRRRRDGRMVQGFPGADELLRELDAAGIERAVLLGWYWEQAASCATQNRFFAACLRAHADRLSAFATVQPAAGPTLCLAELERARDEGLRGVGELSPHAQHHDLTAPGLESVLGWAGAAGWPVNLHVTDPEARPYPGRIATPLADFRVLALRFPGTRFILAHWGGLLPLSGDGPAPANVWYDTAASPLMHGPAIWERFLRAVGPERVLFGSDLPLHLYPREPGSGLARLVAEARAGGADTAVFGENLLKLLGPAGRSAAPSAAPGPGGPGRSPAAPS